MRRVKVVLIHRAPRRIRSPCCARAEAISAALPTRPKTNELAPLHGPPKTELSSIKPETHAAGFSVRAVNNDCMPFRPAERGLCIRNTTKVNRH